MSGCFLDLQHNTTIIIGLANIKRAKNPARILIPFEIFLKNYFFSFVIVSVLSKSSPDSFSLFKSFSIFLIKSYNSFYYFVILVD